MKKITNYFNEEAYQFTTKSGLSVTIIRRPGFKRSVAVYGTPFGSINLKQALNGHVVEHKKGLAHFLEHKLFEDDHKDVLSQFADMGASANAFTSYDQTVYYFSTNLSIDEPLKLLLSFVSRFKLTQEQVDKEKGIIVEELKMYEKMPDSSLLTRTYENVYQSFPMRYDIGGTEASVNATMLEDLKQAYDMNYQDTRMSLVIISDQDPEKIKHIVDQETATHKPETAVVTDLFDDEPVEVSKEYDVYTARVESPKMSLAFKFPYTGSKLLRGEFIIRLILSLNFTEFNDDYQTWLDEGIINDYFSYDVDLRDGFGVVCFFNEGDKHEIFKQIIEDKMTKLTLNQTDFNQILRRYYGQMIQALNQYDRFAINLMTASFKGVNYYDYLDEIRTLTFEDCLEYLEVLKDGSVSFTLMMPE